MMQGKGTLPLPLHPIPSNHRRRKCQGCARSKMSGMLPAVQESAPPKFPEAADRAADALISRGSRDPDRIQHQLLEARRKLGNNLHTVVAQNFFVVDLNDSVVSILFPRF